MQKRRKLFVGILCALLALMILLPIISMIVGYATAGAASRAEIDALEEEKAALSAQKESIQGDIDLLVSEQAGVIEQKNALDLRNELTRQEIELINEQIDLYIAMIAKKELELEEAIEEEELQKSRYRTRMRAMEENGVGNYLSCLFAATSFSDLITRISDISMVLSYDKALEESYIAAREHVELVKADFELAKEEEEAVREELEDKKAQLEADIEAACQIIADLDKDIEKARIEYEKAEAAEYELWAEIQEMLAEIARQEEAARKAAEAAKQSGGSYSGTIVSGTGTYDWPLPGYKPGSAYGWRMHPILGYERFHAGEDIGAPSGTPILAADGGTVSTVAYNGGGYGNYVMLSHGNGKATLYAHMSSTNVTAGQTVSKGDVIGYVGSTGLSTGPHLHFETYVNGSTVDPKSYFNFS